MVYGVCRAMLRDVDEAQDATQEVFLSAYRAGLGGVRARDPAAWLATIARNECRARIAAGMKRPLTVADEDLDLLPAVGDEQLRRSQLEELRAALAQLPERQREAVVLRYLYGLRYGEVAAALGLSRPATEALLFRARRAMRLRLRPVAGAAIVVPSVVREELALALPGLGRSPGAGAAAAGMTGGIIAKLTAGPVGVKVATSAVAISTVGAVGAVPSERANGTGQRPPVVAAAGEARPVPAGDEVQLGHETDTDSSSSSNRSGRRHGHDAAEPSGSDRSGGPGGGSGPTDESHSGRGGGEPGDDTVTPRSGSSGSSSGEHDVSGPAELPDTETVPHGQEDDAGVSDSSSGPGSGDSGSSDSSGSGSGSSGEGGGSAGEGSGSSGTSD
jgi:RNA polymerase sigma factor (sigma-70 family)